MKKLATLASFLFLTTHLCSMPISAAVDREVLAAQAMNSFFVVGFPLISTTSLHKVTGCKAYAIDEHWLLMGAACLYEPAKIKEKETFSLDPDGMVILQRNGYNKDSYSLRKNLNGKRDLEVFVGDNIVLLKFDPKQGGDKYAAFCELLQTAPKINILAFNKTTPENVPGTFKIHTARFGVNGLRERQLKNVYPAEELFTFQEKRKDLSGTSTDPAFLTNAPDLANQAPGIRQNTYWMGVNTAPTVWGEAKGSAPTTWDGKPGPYYHYFTLKDVEFIKKTLSKQDPAASKRVKERLTVL